MAGCLLPLSLGLCSGEEMWAALLFSTMGTRPSGSPETSFNLAENLKSDDYLDGLALGDEGNSKALLQAEKPENTHTEALERAEAGARGNTRGGHKGLCTVTRRVSLMSF